MSVKLPNKSITKRQIRKALFTFQKSREQLLKEVTNQEWRIWLTTPSAWLQYLTSHFTSEQQQSITWYVMSYNGSEFSSIKHTIQAVYESDKFHDIKSFSQMTELYGPILD